LEGLVNQLNVNFPRNEFSDARATSLYMPATRLTIMTMPHLNTSEVLRRYSDLVKNMTLHPYRLSKTRDYFLWPGPEAAALRVAREEGALSGTSNLLPETTSRWRTSMPGTRPGKGLSEKRVAARDG
jgi:hypothetical protein